MGFFCFLFSVPGHLNAHSVGTAERGGEESLGRLFMTGGHHKAKVGRDWSRYGGIPRPNIGYISKIGLVRDCVPTRAGQ